MTPTAPALPRRAALAAFLTLGLATPAALPLAAQEEPSPALAANADGRALLEAAARRLALDDPAGRPPRLVAWLRSAYLQRFQSPSPEPPYDTLPATERVAFDLETDRAAHAFEARWPDFVRRLEQAAGPDGGVVRDLNAGSVREDPTLTPRRLAGLRRYLPAVAVHDALAAAASVRALGPARVGDRDATAVSYVDPAGDVATLYLDTATGLPLAHGVLVDDLRHGDAEDRVLYETYTTVEGLRVPTRMPLTVGGASAGQVVVDSVSVAPERVAEAFAALDGIERAESPPSDATWTELADDVYTVTAAAAPNYHVLVVDRGEAGVLAVDAPASYEVTRALAEAVRHRLGRGVTHAVLTHHHDDHAGGLAAWADAGAVLVTTPGNVSFVRAVATAPRGLAGRGGPRPAPEVVTVDGVLDMPGSPAVVLRDVGPHPHADEHLVALVPGAGLVFQADLVQFPAAGGIEPARPQTASLVALVDGLDWPVRIVAGVHGRAGTVEDLRRAVAAAEGR